MNIEKIKITIILSLNNNLPIDVIRNIWEIIEDDFKRKINIQYIHNMVVQRVNMNKSSFPPEHSRFKLDGKCLFIHPFPFPYPDIGIGSIHNNFESLCIPNNPSFKSILTSIVKKYDRRLIYSHSCCDGYGFGFTKMKDLYIHGYHNALYR